MITPERRGLLGLEGLNAETISGYLESARRYLPTVERSVAPEHALRGAMAANLFFEDSTRTRSSFARAAMLLGMQVVDLTESGSSASKGETLLDTALNLDAMGFDVLIVRCSASGGASAVAARTRCPIVNAGDGRHEHPTQGLLDVMTIQESLGTVQGRAVAIVGDINNSRVARSDMHALSALGATTVLVAPPTLVDRRLARAVQGAGEVRVEHDFDAVLPHVDAVIMLRVQLERDAGSGVPADFRAMYGLTAARCRALRDRAIIMHPGPMNRGVEIDAAGADSARSRILRQVTLGVAVRMAVLERAVHGA